MAILILSARGYANLLDKAIASHNNLKIRRAIAKLRAKKRSARQIQINLEQTDAVALTGFIYDGDFIQREATPEQLAAQLDAFATENVVVDAPYIVYSISEWKAIVEMATKCPSTIVTTDPEIQNVFYPLAPVFDWVEWTIIGMIRRAHGQGDSHEIETRQLIQEEQEQLVDPTVVTDGAVAFGAVSESEDDDEEDETKNANNI